MGNDLSPKEWREEKQQQGRKRIPFKDPTEQREELERIVATIKKYIKEDQETPKGWEDNIDPEYFIKAAIIYGSWAQGESSQQSDVDIAFIQLNKYPNDRTCEYICEDSSNETGYFFDDMGIRIYWEDERLKEVLDGKHDLIGSEFIVVTPFSEIRERIVELNPNVRIY